jgi:ComF family protein
LEGFGTGPMFCERCQNRFAPLAWNGCEHCGAPFAESVSPDAGCPYCRGETFEFDAVVALDAHRGPLRDAILRLKRPGAESLAQAMAALLCQRRGEQIRAYSPNLVIPIPMHWLRRFIRQGNNPDILAGAIANFLGAPCRTRTLRRTRNTKAQKGLDARQRRRNQVGAFSVRAGYDMKGARVLLVDDVLTTGATCHHAAKVLKLAGASSVAVAGLGRAIGEADA